MNDVSKWYYERPKNYYEECKKMFGCPLFVSNVKGGYALWKCSEGDLFKEHLLIDEDVLHKYPKLHHDYFYSRIECVIPKDKVCDVLKISGSILYDGLKKELTARCGGINANYATLYLGLLVAQDYISIDDVSREDMYGKMIRGEIISHKQMKKELEMLKKENHKKYRKELKQTYSSFTQRGGRDLNQHWRD